MQMPESYIQLVHNSCLQTFLLLCINCIIHDAGCICLHLSLCCCIWIHEIQFGDTVPMAGGSDHTKMIES
jgi:hypothetical protein